MDRSPPLVLESKTSKNAGPLAVGARVGVYIVFTISGSAALIYQILWARSLSLSFGNTTASVSVVLASFMLGLALGSWVAGRSLSRIENPMFAYAYLEFGIGAFAIAFPWLLQATDSLFSAIVRDDSAQSLALAVRAVLACALLGIPTTLMGATLPLLTDFFRRSPRHTRAWNVGLLYAANTLGAAIGSLIASFVLIELVGVRMTTLIAAALNCLVGTCAFAYARGATLVALPSKVTPLPSFAAIQRLAITILAASGASALASEVLWTRALQIQIGNSSYGFALILVVYLVGLAGGSWAVSLIVKRLAHLVLWLAATQAAMALWIMAAVGMFNTLSYRLSPNGIRAPGMTMMWLPVSVPVSVLLLNYLRAASILLPLGLLSGAVFPIATRLLSPRSEEAEGQLIARAYAWNTFGAVVGSLVAGFWIAPRLDYFDALFLLSGAYSLTALLGFGAALRCADLKTSRRRAAFLAAASGAIGLLAVAGMRTEVTRWRQVHEALEVLFHEPGIQGVTSVFRFKQQEFLVVNGSEMTVKVPATKMMAHLPLLVHPAPVDTLVICFGMGTTYRSALSHGGRVTVVELVPEVFKAFPFFFADADRVLSNPKGRMISNDGRNYLKLTHDRFDVITIDPPPPIDAAGVSNLYSKEFYALARDRLKPGGIMAQWIVIPGIRAGVDDWETYFMLLRTFKEVFPHTLTLAGLPAAGFHVLGSLQPIEVSREGIEKRLKDAAVAADINEWGAIPSDYVTRLSESSDPRTDAANLNTDDRPRLEFGLMRAWRTGQTKTYPLIW